MPDLASLVLKVDSSQVPKGTAALNELTKVGERTEKQISHITAEQYKAIKAVEAFAAATGKLKVAANDATAASGRMRGGMQQLSFQMNDVATQFAMGTKASTIFAQQSGQVIQALSLMANGTKGVLGFLAGPWGLALTTALVVLTPFVGKMFEGHDALGKMIDDLKDDERQTKLSDQAHAAFARTIEGSIAAVDKLTEALKKQNLTLEDNVNLAKAAAAQALVNVSTNIGAVSGKLVGALSDLHSARSELARAESGVFAGSSTEAAAQVAAAQAGVRAAEANVRSLSAQLEALGRSAEGGASALRAANFPLIEAQAKELYDPIARINRQYDEMAKKAKQAGTYTQEFANSLERQRKAALDAAEATRKASPFSGGGLSFAQAASIARGAGYQVNSAQRSYAEQKALYDAWVAAGKPKNNPVAPPGSSAHEGANGKWALDIQIKGDARAEASNLKKLFGDRGVAVNILPERGHLHVSGKLSDEESAAQKELLAAVDRQQAFQAESGKLDAEILQAKGQLVKGTDAQAAFAIQQLRQDQTNYEAGINRLVADKKLEAADGLALKFKHAQVNLEKQIAIEAEQRNQHEKDEAELQKQVAERKIDELRFADEMATTSGEHRDAQLAILDAVYTQRRLELEHAKQLAVRNDATADQIAIIQSQIDDLPRLRAQDRTRTMRGTMNPLEVWADSIPHTEKQITEAFQRIQVNALEGLTNAITEVIMGTKSLGAAFKDVARSIIADIIQMTVRMLIFRAISGLFGGGSGGITVTGSSAGAVGKWANGGVFSGGNVVPFAVGGIVSGPTMFPMSGGRTGLMGEAGPEAVMPLARDSQGRLGVRAGNDNTQRVVVELTLDNELLGARIVEGANAVVEIKRPGIVSQSVNATMRTANRPVLMGRR